MRRARSMLWLGFLLMIMACSRHPTRPAEIGPTGQPLTGEGTIERESWLVWSGITGEILCTASLDAADPGALIAVRVSNGTVRTLDPAMSLAPLLSTDRTSVFYNTFSSDPLHGELRHRPLRSGVPLTLASCDGFCVFIHLPGPDADHVAWGCVRVEFETKALYRALGSSDSLVLHQLSTGIRRPLTTGQPLLFSPDGQELLYKDFFEPFRTAQILTLATGATRPAGLDIPDSSFGGRLRWDAQGLSALYLAPGGRRLMRHHATTGSHETVWESSDSLSGLVWSPSGRKAAIWTIDPDSVAAVPTRPRFEQPRYIHDLYVVDLHRKDATRVAHGPGGGAIVFSPDESQIAYLFDQRLYLAPLGAGALATRLQPTPGLETSRAAP